jgi:hypothetical protein
MQDERRRAVGVTKLGVRKRAARRCLDEFGGFLSHICHALTLSITGGHVAVSAVSLHSGQLGHGYGAPSVCSLRLLGVNQIAVRL